MWGPDCGMNSSGLGPALLALKEQLSGVLPSNCLQPLALSQPRGAVTPPLARQPRQPEVSCGTLKRLLLTTKRGLGGKPPSTNQPYLEVVPGPCARTDTLAVVPGAEILSPLNWAQILKFDTLSPHSPHTPDSHVPDGDCPWLYLGRGYMDAFCFPVPKPLLDWPTGGQGHVLSSETQQHLSLAARSPTRRISIWTRSGHTQPFPSTAFILGAPEYRIGN